MIKRQGNQEKSGEGHQVNWLAKLAKRLRLGLKVADADKQSNMTQT